LQQQHPLRPPPSLSAQTVHNRNPAQPSTLFQPHKLGAFCSKIRREESLSRSSREVQRKAARVPWEGKKKASSPEREAREGAKKYWIYTHAVLMSVAWVGLLPREC
jgi:hypothetical protein